MNPNLRDVCLPNWNAAAAPTAVLLFLHGFGSSEQDFAFLALMLGLNLPWASLRASRELGNGRAAWFEITTPGIPEAAPVEEASAAILAWAEENVASRYPVVPIGFSQGGLMASQVLRTRPGRVVAPAVLGGFVLGLPQPGDSALRASLPALFWGRGAQDRVIAPAAITRNTEFLFQHTTVTERVYPGLAHGINAAEVADLHGFISGELDSLVAPRV